jgi:hypothetical protein
MYDAMEDPLP